MPPDSETLLFCGLSGRSFAQSARAAGFRPVVLDAFADTDTGEAAAAVERIPCDSGWRFDEVRLLDAAARLAPPPVPLVWGSGLERHQDLVAKLAVGRELLGCPPAQVRRLKDPLAFAALARAMAVPHPEIQAAPPAAPVGWLRKRAGGAGGAHVRPARATDVEVPGWYFQRRVAGTPVAALILGEAGEVRLLGLSDQWTAPGSAISPFRYGGAALPARLAPALAAELGEAALAIGRAAAIRGLASLDFLAEGPGRWHLLEINPRPGASLDAYERACQRGLIGDHVAACRGQPLSPPPAVRSAAASALVYARADFMRIPVDFDWPEWTADRTPGGEAVLAGQPVCTVLAEAAGVAEVRALVERRGAAILDRLERETLGAVMPAACRSSTCESASLDAARSSEPYIARR